MADHRGIAAGAAAFVMWGLLPVYWKLMAEVPAYEILCHRMVWSLPVALALLAVSGRFTGFLSLVRQRNHCLYLLGTSLILAANWLTYIWAVNSGNVIEASLGYFINPLVSVCLGVVFLKETIRPWQWFSVLLAFVAVSYLTLLYGAFPWIALALASTFGGYGLLRKIAPAPPLEGLGVETAILFLPALTALGVFEARGTGTFLHAPASLQWLLAGSGIATSFPLLTFCYAARRIPLYAVGLLQYLAPTLTLLVGIHLYGEPFPPERMAGFALIWLALAIFVGDGLKRQWRLRQAARQGDRQGS